MAAVIIFALTAVSESSIRIRPNSSERLKPVNQTPLDHAHDREDHRVFNPPQVMINRVIDFSVEHKFAVMLLVAVAACAGYWSLHHMPLDAIPDLSDTQVIV